MNKTGEFKIYCNKGVLGSEKKNVYTYNLPHPNAKCSEQMTARLPENNVFSIAGTNEAGELLIHSSWGWNYTVNELLQGNENPCFLAIDDTMMKRMVRLDIIPNSANTNEWVNMGDIDFVVYGGCLVRPHWSKKDNLSEEMKYTYDVFYLNSEFGENGDENYAALCCIDLTDSWLPWKDMLKCCGYDEYADLTFEELLEHRISPELLAKEMIEYMGVGNFSPVVMKNGTLIQYPTEWQDFVISDKDLDKWLISIGAGEFAGDAA